MQLQANIGPKRHILVVPSIAVESNSDATGSVWPKNAMVCFLSYSVSPSAEGGCS